jgi:type IV fimbrial biogenesis protein FimT
MVAILVAAILVAVAVPSFETTINNSRLAAASNELLVSLQTARLEAMRYNRRTAVCLSENADSATPACAGAGSTTANGWITYTDNDSNNQLNAGDAVLHQSTLPPRVKVIVSPGLEPASNNQVSYRADGFARKPDNSMAAGNIDLCLEVRRPEENIRRLNVAVGSRLSITHEKNNATCEQPDDPS